MPGQSLCYNDSLSEQNLTQTSSWFNMSSFSNLYAYLLFLCNCLHNQHNKTVNTAGAEIWVPFQILVCNTSLHRNNSSKTSPVASQECFCFCVVAVFLGASLCHSLRRKHFTETFLSKILFCWVIFLIFS